MILNAAAWVFMHHLVLKLHVQLLVGAQHNCNLIFLLICDGHVAFSYMRFHGNGDRPHFPEDAEEDTRETLRRTVCNLFTYVWYVFEIHADCGVFMWKLDEKKTLEQIKALRLPL